MERVRKISHYVVLPTALAGTEIPMQRYRYNVLDEEGVPTGETKRKTANEIAPDARRSLDGSKMIFGMELDNLMEAIGEFQNGFTKQDQLQILSHTEAVELMKTPEWTAPEEVPE